jgi:hypothetical protein
MPRRLRFRMPAGRAPEHELHQARILREECSGSGRACLQFPGSGHHAGLMPRRTPCPSRIILQKVTKFGHEGSEDKGRPKRLRLEEVTPTAAPLRSRRRENECKLRHRGTRSGGSHRTRTFAGRRRGRHRRGLLHRPNALVLLGTQWPPSRPERGADRIGRQ